MFTRAAFVLLALLPQAQAARRVVRKSNRNASSLEPAATAKLEEKEPSEFVATAADQDQSPPPIACVASSAVLSAVRFAVNQQLSRALIGRDPANFTYHAFKYDLNLYLCSVGVEMDTSVEVSGFASANIGELTCLKEECLQPEGSFRCAKKDLTFSAKVYFANVLGINGENAANWDLCGVAGGLRNVSLGFESREPGIMVEFVVTREGSRIRDRTTTIKMINGLETSWGTLQNFKCGFSALPNFVGSYLESWCTSITSFVAERVQTTLQGTITRQLLKLINRVIDVPNDEEDM